MIVHSQTKFELDTSKFAWVGQIIANFQKIQNLKKSKREIQYQRSFIDVLYMCTVLGR